MTALKKLIKRFDEIKDLDYYVQIMILRGESESLLEIEKQDLINAFDIGKLDVANKRNGNDYFNQTYVSKS